jgi:hypothetical protein
MGVVPSAKKTPGRPPKFTPDVAWRVIALLSAGATVKATAADVDVTPRAIQSWRARAYSSRPEDRLYVEFEQALTRGLIASAESGQRASAVNGPTEPRALADVFTDLERDFTRSEHEQH